MLERCVAAIGWYWGIALPSCGGSVTERSVTDNSQARAVMVENGPPGALRDGQN
jgi:hypothetical protein